MKNYLKISLVVTLIFVVSGAMAQSSESVWPVSKEVNRYSNKSLATHRSAPIKSLGTPSFAMSKLRNTRKQPAHGNIPSNYPTWAIGKGVTQINKK